MAENYAKDLVNKIEVMPEQEFIEYLEDGDVYFLVSASGEVYDIEAWRNYADGRMKITKDGCFFYGDGVLKNKWYFSDWTKHFVLSVTEENFKGFKTEV